MGKGGDWRKGRGSNWRKGRVGVPLGAPQGRLFGPAPVYPSIENYRPHGDAKKGTWDLFADEALERLRQIYGRKCVDQACQIYESEKYTHKATAGAESARSYEDAIARICQRIGF